VALRSVSVVCWLKEHGQIQDLGRSIHRGLGWKFPSWCQGQSPGLRPRADDLLQIILCMEVLWKNAKQYCWFSIIDSSFVWWPEVQGRFIWARWTLYICHRRTWQMFTDINTCNRESSFAKFSSSSQYLTTVGLVTMQYALVIFLLTIRDGRILIFSRIPDSDTRHLISGRSRIRIFDFTCHLVYTYNKIQEIASNYCFL